MCILNIFTFTTAVC